MAYTLGFTVQRLSVSPAQSLALTFWCSLLDEPWLFVIHGQRPTHLWVSRLPPGSSGCLFVEELADFCTLNCHSCGIHKHCALNLSSQTVCRYSFLLAGFNIFSYHTKCESHCDILHVCHYSLLTLTPTHNLPLLCLLCPLPPLVPFLWHNPLLPSCLIYHLGIWCWAGFIRNVKVLAILVLGISCLCCLYLFSRWKQEEESVGCYL